MNPYESPAIGSFGDEAKRSPFLDVAFWLRFLGTHLALVLVTPALLFIPLRRSNAQFAALLGLIGWMNVALNIHQAMFIGTKYILTPGVSLECYTGVAAFCYVLNVLAMLVVADEIADR